MPGLELPLDRYTLRARLGPALLMVLPACLGVLAWFPRQATVPEGATWVVVALVLALLLAQFVRDAGFQKERRLFDSWDGPPTTRFLRHRDDRLGGSTRTRYHQRLTRLLPDLQLPSAADEDRDPTGADQQYGSCVRHLREKTRSAGDFHLVHETNTEYGFRRNLWAVKPTGIGLALLGTVATGARLGMAYAASEPIGATTLAGAVVSASLLVWWCGRITPSWVRVAADAYAERLLATCETLEAEPAAEPRIVAP